MQKKNPAKRRPERLVVTLLSLLFLSTAVFATVKYVFRAPELDTDKPVVTPDGTASTDADRTDTDEPDAPGRTRREYCYNILVSGLDDDNGGSDTNILVRFDVPNKRIDLVSLPRDTLLHNEYRNNKLNFAYAKGGTELLMSQIENLLGVPVDFYVTVNLKGFIALVDQIDGVDFDIPINMDYDDPYQDLHIHQTKGYRLLSGSDVMQVLRYRHDTDSRYGYADGDLGRIKTQQSLLKAMIEQLLQLKNVTKIGDFARVVKNNVTSDLTFEEMLWFGSQAVMGGLKIENVNFVTMPNTNKSCYSRAYHSMQSYVTPNAQELLDLVNNELSPFVEKFTMRDLDIMSVNSDGSVSSSTGHVEDSKAAQPQNHHSSSGSQTGTGDSGTTTDPGTATNPGNTGDNSGTTVDPGNTGDNSGGTTVDPGNTGDNSGTTTPSEPTTPVDPVTPTDPGTGESGTTGDNSGTAGSDEMPEWLRP